MVAGPGFVDARGDDEGARHVTAVTATWAPRTAGSAAAARRSAVGHPGAGRCPAVDASAGVGRGGRALVVRWSPGAVGCRDAAHATHATDAADPAHPAPAATGVARS